MLGWRRRARIAPSRRNRSCAAASKRPLLSSLTAASPSKRPSLRRARQTLPMPPSPIGSTSVHGPSTSPAAAVGASIASSAGATDLLRKPAREASSPADSSARSSRAVSGSLAAISSSRRARSSGARVSSSSRRGSRRAQSSGRMALMAASYPSARVVDFLDEGPPPACRTAALLSHAIASRRLGPMAYRKWSVDPPFAPPTPRMQGLLV